jgi:hypothetical protein
LLELVWLELQSLGPPLSVDLQINPPCNILLIFNELVVWIGIFLGGSKEYAELIIVPHLAQSPLLVSVDVIVEGLLFECLELSELEYLSEQELLWLGVSGLVCSLLLLECPLQSI